MKRTLISLHIYLRCFRFLAIAAALLPVAASGQSAPLVPSHKSTKTATKTSNPVVARVNGVGLTQKDLQRQMQKLFPFSGVHGGRVPGEYGGEVRRQALDQIIFEELVHQEAMRRKMTVPASMFRDILRQAQGRFPSKAEYESYAAQEFGSVQAFESNLRRGILIALLIDQEIVQKARITEAQVQQFYNENKQRFQKPESIALQTISLNLPPKATAAHRAQIRKRAEEVLPQAKAAKTFEEFGKLAEKYSEDDWRIMMGDHRWVHRGRLPAEVEEAAFRMSAGEVSDIVEMPEAFVIVRVNGKQPQTQVPYEQMSTSLRGDLEKTKLSDLRKNFEQRLRKTYRVEEL